MSAQKNSARVVSASLRSRARRQGTVSVEMVILITCIAVAGLGFLAYLGRAVRAVITG